MNNPPVSVDNVALESDYAKVRRLPYLYVFSMFTGAAVLIAVGAPFTLFLTELGFAPDKIGLLGGMMPFFQVFGIAFLPMVLKFGCKRVSILAFFARYFFFLLFFLVSFFQTDLNKVFWILFLAMALFSLARTIAEAAFVPWSQEMIPRSIRGSISGKLALYYLPIGLLVSYLVKVWLDSRIGLDRFYPVFALAIILGFLGAASLLRLGGGRASTSKISGVATFRSISRPIHDRNFLLFLFSSSTQYLVFLVVNLFLILYFKDKFGVPAGQLVLMTSLSLIGGAIGSFSGGWLVDRHGSRGVRLTMQAGQVLLLLLVALLPVDGFVTTEFLGGIFIGFGILFGASITAGNVYVLNYVPSDAKESYLGLAYSVDGVIGGTATFAAGFLVFWLQSNDFEIFGLALKGYETLFVFCALIVAASAIAYAFLQEYGATGVKDFLRQFYVGNPLGVMWGILRYGQQSSEERRLGLTHRFGGSGSVLAREELLHALYDPSFDVRHEAIVALGHLPNGPKVVSALETVLDIDGMAELKYAAITALGRIHAKSSGAKIARFLTEAHPFLRARAIRALGDIRDTTYQQVIRDMLINDPDNEVRLAAVSALGKLKDQNSFAALLAQYCKYAELESQTVDAVRGKVTLLAISKIIGREAAFLQEWRREDLNPGFRLPVMISKSLVGRGKDPANFADNLAIGITGPAFQALQSLQPKFSASTRPADQLALQILVATKDIKNPHPALLVLLALVTSPVMGR